MAMAGGAPPTLKSSIFSIQIRLLEGVSSDEQLQAAGRALTQSEYGDVVTERSIVQLCGFPLCSHALPHQSPHKGRYRISLREHKVYDLQETRLFCSTECLIASRTFSASLASERDVLGDIHHVINLAEAFKSLFNHELNRADNLTGQIPQEAGADNPQLAVKMPEQGMDSDQCQDFQALELKNFEHREELVDISDKLAENKNVKVPIRDAPQQGNSEDSSIVSPCRQKAWLEGNEKESGISSESSSRDLEKKAAANLTESTSKTFQANEFTSAILIHEQNHVSISNFDMAGPSNAIEGYIPFKEHGETSFRRSMGGAKQAGFSTPGKKQDKHEVHKKSPSGNSRKTKSISKQEGEVDKAAPVKSIDETFTSSMLVDGQPLTASIHIAAEVRKKQNRVSWADQNNRKLVDSVVISSYATRVEMPASDNLNEKQTQVKGQSWAHEGLDREHERLESVEELVAALTEAADAVAQGEACSAEAVARAGICIRPFSQGEVQSSASVQYPDYLTSNLAGVSENLSGRLPGNDANEEFDQRTSWYSAPPKEFKPELSTFGMMWVALDGWFSAASVAHVYGRDPFQEDDFTSVNGKEYRRQVVIGDGVSAEVERTLAGCISRALPGLVESFRLPIPRSSLEQALGRFLRTMNLVDAIPPFNLKQWRLILLLFLDALSIQRLPLLRDRITGSRLQFHKVLELSNVTEDQYEVFKDLLLPLGRHPDFAARSGA